MRRSRRAGLHRRGWGRRRRRCGPKAEGSHSRFRAAAAGSCSIYTRAGGRYGARSPAVRSPTRRSWMWTSAACGSGRPVPTRRRSAPHRVRLRRLSRVARLAMTAASATFRSRLRTLNQEVRTPTAASPRRVLAERSGAIVMGVAAGIAAGLAVATGNPAAAAGVLVLAAVALGAVRAIVPDADRGDVAKVALFALSLRLGAAAVLYAGAVAVGRGGFITGDDGAYSRIAWGYAQWLHGAPVWPYIPPAWGGGGYLLGTFAYLTSAVYYVFGLQPLLVSFMNAALVTVAIVLCWDIARQVFGRKAATLTIAVLSLDPANVLFSALLLKDSLSL